MTDRGRDGGHVIARPGSNGKEDASATDGDRASARSGQPTSGQRLSLPELGVVSPARDARWKPPGGVAARFGTGGPARSRAEAERTEAAPDTASGETARPSGSDGNGTADADRPPAPDADAITIELKSS